MSEGRGDTLTLNRQVDYFNGIWYMNQPLDNEYRFKYSGGLGTYCAKHSPFAVYAEKINKTFFCYGAADIEFYKKQRIRLPSDGDNIEHALYHAIAYYDHSIQKVSRPTLVIDKKTSDAHDNPVIAIDKSGYIWMFSTSHGISRPSYIHKSCEPYNIEKFELVNALRLDGGKKVPFNNFSYLQIRYSDKYGFQAFTTFYNAPVERTIGYISSKDGVNWSEWKPLAAIGSGHYQISAFSDEKIATAFNYHPLKQGLNYRTNLYYFESEDNGVNWSTVSGCPVDIPVKEIQNPALIKEYQSSGLLVYLKDMEFDRDGNPVILYLLSPDYASGPHIPHREWHVAYWNGYSWEDSVITSSDSNYDMGSIYIEDNNIWKVIVPTGKGPQEFNPGGEVVMWESNRNGKNWRKVKQITENSEFNHTYIRKPVNAHEQFYAFWADGNAREPSVSRLYFCNKNGEVVRL